MQWVEWKALGGDGRRWLEATPCLLPKPQVTIVQLSHSLHVRALYFIVTTEYSCI